MMLGYDRIVLNIFNVMFKLFEKIMNMIQMVLIDQNRKKISFFKLTVTSENITSNFEASKMFKKFAQYLMNTLMIVK